MKFFADDKTSVSLTSWECAVSLLTRNRILDSPPSPSTRRYGLVEREVKFRMLQRQVCDLSQGLHGGAADDSATCWGKWSEDKSR
jgi:hypothetical protein